MIPLLAYTDRFSAAPGEEIAFKVSSAAAGPYRASLVRLVCGDPNPAGPGLQIEDLAARFSIERPSRAQPVAMGSYARVGAAARLRIDGPLTLVALVWPTLPERGEQCVLSRWDPASAGGFALSIGPRGVTAAVGVPGGAATEVSTGRALEARQWHRIWLVVDRAGGALRVGQVRLGSAAPDGGLVTAETRLPATASLDAPAPLLIGARAGNAGTARDYFNGKIEDPALLATAARAPEALAFDPALPTQGLIAGWDFARGIDTLDVTDVGPHRLGGSLVNLPTRAVTGARWSGREMCWRHAPRDYAAIHFHEDDLHDVGWATDFTFRVPADLRSGAYAMRLVAGEHVDTVPFWVRAPLGQPGAPILVLASTYTYMAYANFTRGNVDAAFRARIAAWGAYPHTLDDHRDYGLSTYNRHSDGSGVSFTSRLRPILNLRPGFLTFNDSRGSGLRHFNADTHLLAWLGSQGIAYDVATDEDIDDHGAALLGPYAVVLTGAHPEYHTAGSLDAIQGYLERGGRLLYLGGNGFYWRVGRSRTIPGVIEVRRTESGIRTWEARPGEYYHALDGAYGGLWRRNGRPPQRLVGVGFTSQGDFEGSYYRRRPAADDPRVAWIFAGVRDEIIGDFGLSGGGAAGFELDRADPALGTPPGAVVLAASEKHGPSFVAVPEELLSHIATTTGEPPAKLIRSDMTYVELPGGGAVFSVGSISFCGSLSHNGGDNNVSRIVRNVVERFRDRR
jgi:N,N-dimethylformamidase